MFLQSVNRLFSAKTLFSVKTLRCSNIAFGRSELIDKWMQKFASENISEPERSIRHILEHIVGQNQVEFLKSKQDKCVFKLCNSTACSL